MNNRIKNSMLALTLAASSLFAVAPAQAGIISYDFSVTIDTVTASLFNQTFTGSFSFDDAQTPSPGFNGEDLYSLLDFSFDFVSNLYTQSDLFYGDAALLGNQFLGLDLGALEFSFLPANELFAASFSYDFGAGDAGNGSIVYVPLIGPVPEPSIIWLMVGALAALAGVSTRTRGIHESV